MKRKRWFLIGGAAVLLPLMLLTMVVLGVWIWFRTAEPGRVVISEETTRIFAPLDAEGYVDYVEALNQRYGRGVTPENNAAVPFWQAMGPEPVRKEARQEYFRRLGLSLPEEGDYFVGLGVLIERQLDAKPAFPVQVVYDQEEKSSSDPWSAEDYPLIAAWIEENEKPLATLVSGLSCERLYSPLLAPKAGARVLGMLLYTSSAAKEPATALTVRAMLRLGRGELEQARQDVLAVHRLGRLIAQGPTLVGQLEGIVIDGMAAHADVAILAHEELTADQAREYAASLRALPPLPNGVEAIDACERYTYLDTVTAMARWGIAGVLDTTVGDNPDSNGAAKSLTKALGQAAFDWNILLRMGNERYDRLVAALSLPTHRERFEALEELEQEVRQYAEEVRNRTDFLNDVLSGGTRESMSEGTGKAMVALMLPATTRFADASERSMAAERLVLVAHALEGYRAEHDCYPDELAALCQTYLEAVPDDPFADAPMRYVRENDGYRLYSVGSNMKDDGGRNGNSDVVYVPAQERLPGGFPLRDPPLADADDVVVHLKR